MTIISYNFLVKVELLNGVFSLLHYKGKTLFVDHANILQIINIELFLPDNIPRYAFML